MVCTRLTIVIIIVYVCFAILKLPFTFLEVLQYNCAYTMHLLSIGSEFGWGGIFVPMKAETAYELLSRAMFAVLVPLHDRLSQYIMELTRALSIFCYPYYKSESPAHFQK
jgi:hypothetical protein